MSNTKEIAISPNSDEEIVSECVTRAYDHTRSFHRTVALMVAATECVWNPLLCPWLVLDHCLSAGVDASLEFGWVSRKGKRRCTPHIWVVTSDGILDPVVLSMMMDKKLPEIELGYHKEVPPGYEHPDDEILTTEWYAHERQGLRNYILEEIHDPVIQKTALALCDLSDRIAPLGDVTV